jgi:hypothetical protein
VHGVVQRVSFLFVVAVGLMLIVAPGANAHSGGLDKYGCHAGSQPYHCHNGGGGGGGGGGGSAAPRTLVNTGPSADEVAHQAEVKRAKAKVATAKSAYTASKKAAKKQQSRVKIAQRELDRQREAADAVKQEADQKVQDAAELREKVKAEQSAAARRVALAQSSHREAEASHRESVAASALGAALFGGILLYRVVRTYLVNVRGVAARSAAGIGLFFASLILIGAAPSGAPLAVQVVMTMVGGLLLAVLLIALRVWLISAKLPPKVALGAMVLAGLIAAGSLAGVFASAPEQEAPAEDDVALIQQAKESADGESAEVVQAEQAAAKLQDRAAQEAEEVARLEARLTSTARRAAKADKAVAADKKRYSAAKESLFLVE